MDIEPSQLFKLRGVNFAELIDVNQAVLDVISTKPSRRKRLEDSAFTDLFDFEKAENPAIDTKPAL